MARSAFGVAMRRRIFTPATIQIVRELAGQGKSAAEIAARIGSTPGSVRVKSSQHKIKLGHRGRPSLRPVAAGPGEAKKLQVELRSPDLAALNRRAALMGKTPTVLASALLETIVTSDLFNAVLDEH
jgi:transposase-like protein